jgi:allantoicase
MTDFEELVDLASERLRGSVLWATDDFFAEKENLLKPAEPVFIEGKYTDRGKWMDGWESRRKRSYASTSVEYREHDVCIIRLGLSGIVRGVVVDTTHFKGNYPKSCMLEGATITGYPDVTDLLWDKIQWTEVLKREDLQGDTKNRFSVSSHERFTHLRFTIFPDGGVARLRIHGDVVPYSRWMGRSDRPQLVDLAAAENGALVVSCNDMFFGSRHNLIMPGRGVNMGDGWETKRSRRPGPDWVVVRLATRGAIERAIVDTHHFKGNAPDACAIDIATSGTDPDGSRDDAWRPLLPKTKLQPHTQHFFEDEIVSAGEATHVRLRIWPDGGVSRLRLFGIASAEGRERSGMRYFRSMPEPELRTALLACCGSKEWAKKMIEARSSFTTLGELQKTAADIWMSLSAADWDEAFKAHPKIGEKKTEGSIPPPGGKVAQTWSAKEQSLVADASPATLEALREVNRAYEERFGRIYIVCATGKTADEMLAIAKERMRSDPETELRRAADEQRRITKLRLDKLVLR